MNPGPPEGLAAWLAAPGLPPATAPRHTTTARQPLNFLPRLRYLGGSLTMIRTRQVEVDPAQRPLRVRLAQDHGDLPVQGNAMPQARPPALKCLDRLVHQRSQRRLHVVRWLLQADHIPVKGTHGLRDLPFERLGRHAAKLESPPSKAKPEMQSVTPRLSRWQPSKGRTAHGRHPAPNTPVPG